ncbi:MAG: hypothetical protein R3D27_02600 [Hyphomicrobiaceae bacterium]
MGAVVKFASSGARARRSERSAGKGGDASAEIVLFPGIRYERAVETTPSRRAARGERDRLELID